MVLIGDEYNRSRCFLHCVTVKRMRPELVTVTSRNCHDAFALFAAMKRNNHIRASVAVAALLFSAQASAQTPSAPATSDAAAPVPTLSTATPETAPAPEAKPAPAPEAKHGDALILGQAAFGKGATIKSADDKFSLNIRGRMQVRATMTKVDGEEDPITGMQIRRQRIVLQGNAMGPALTYYIQLAFSNLDMEPDLRSPLRDAYFTWILSRDLNLRVGQMKVPYGRQRVVSSSALQMVDRSIVTGEFNLDRDAGVHMFSKDLFGLGGKLAYSAAIFGGDGRNRVADKFGMLYAGRIQVSPMGGFDDFVEADIKREASPKLAIGINGAYNQDSNRAKSTFSDVYPTTFDQRHAGADLLFKWNGLSVSGEWMWRKADSTGHSVLEKGATAPKLYAPRSGWGGYGQVGQMLTDKLEIEGRYGYLTAINDSPVGVKHELGGGFSYYIAEHNLKVQTDYFYLPGKGFENGAHEVRLQTQLYF
jgi:phosphate-selective porin OprO and OprP